MHFFWTRTRKLTKVLIGRFLSYKKPQDINLYDVITAIEGPVALNKCTVNKKSCSLSRTCKVHPIWVTVRREIEEVLKKNTFNKIRESQIR